MGMEDGSSAGVGPGSAEVYHSPGRQQASTALPEGGGTGRVTPDSSEMSGLRSGQMGPVFVSSSSPSAQPLPATLAESCHALAHQGAGGPWGC